MKINITTIYLFTQTNAVVCFYVLFLHQKHCCMDVVPYEVESTTVIFLLSVDC
jgi:hypothetical protein